MTNQRRQTGLKEKKIYIYIFWVVLPHTYNTNLKLGKYFKCQKIAINPQRQENKCRKFYHVYCMFAPLLQSLSSAATGHHQRWNSVLPEPVTWAHSLMVLSSCANHFKVNYLRSHAWALPFGTESYAGAAYCSVSLLKILLLEKTQYENESQWLLKRPTVHSLIASRELSLIWRRFCLFQVLCQSLTYTSFPTPMKIHKRAQRPPKYIFNTEKWFAGFVFQLKVFVTSVLISLHNRIFSCKHTELTVHQQGI